MILQVITPQKETFDLPVAFPKDYLGKQVFCLFYIKEEAQTLDIPLFSKKKPSDFFGTLSAEQGEKMQAYILQSRSEWERDS